MMTRAQRIAKAKLIAKGKLRVEQLRQHAAAGSTIEQAARAIGLSLGGVRAALYRVTGSTKWPPVE